MEKEVAELIADQDPDLECRSYSGRGMYGRETYGIICNQLGDFLGALVSATIVNQDVMENCNFQRVKTDEMGLSLIVY